MEFKLKKSIVLLTILMIICASLAMVLGFNSTKAYAKGATNIARAYLSINENIVVNYEAENIDSSITTAKMKFTYRGQEYSVVSDVVDGKASFAFDKVTPQYLGENVKAELLLNEVVVDTEETFSVKGYCQSLLALTSNELGVTEPSCNALKRLAVDILYYGDASQQYTDTAVDNLATKDLTDAQKLYKSDFVTVDSTDLSKGSNTENMLWFGYGLRFDYNVSMYVEFALKSAPQGDLSVEFTKGENASSVEAIPLKSIKGYQIYKASYKNLSATEFDSVITAKVKDNGNYVGDAFSYSVKSFVYDNQNDAIVGDIAKAVYNYGKSTVNYRDEHTSHNFSGDYGIWVSCDSCETQSWTQNATAVNSNGITKTTETGPYEYVLKDGGDITNINDYTKTNTRIALSSVSYNLGQGTNQDFSYTVNVTEGGLAKVIVRMRNTNQNTARNANDPYQLNKTLKLYKGSISEENEILISNDVILKYEPEISGGAVFYEYTLGITNLEVGDNTIILHFFKSGEIDASGKPRGGYLQYMRLETIDNNCSTGIHLLTKVAEQPATCTSTGVLAHYTCKDCNKLFLDINAQTEVTMQDLIIEKLPHVYSLITYVDGTTHKETCSVCGDVKVTNHTHIEGEYYLIVAKNPNKVWYVQGETLNTDRMEIYKSDICADGCSNTSVDMTKITYTYQNGNAFTAGDTYVTLSYIDGENTYFGKIYVKVVATAGDLLTLDNTDSGVTLKDNSSGSQNISNRATDTAGLVGQSGYGGSYISSIGIGDVVKFTFNLDEAKNGNVVLQASSNATVRGSGSDGFPQYTKTARVNSAMQIKINGEVVTLSDDVVLNGTVTNLTASTNRWVWTNWTSVDLGQFDLIAGANTIEITFKNSEDLKDTYGNPACGQIDCLNIFF